jgi:hypothetical protein
VQLQIAQSPAVKDPRAGREADASADFALRLAVELGQAEDEEAFSIRGRRESEARRPSGEREEEQEDERVDAAWETDRLLTREKAQ